MLKIKPSVQTPKLSTSVLCRTHDELYWSHLELLGRSLHLPWGSRCHLHDDSSLAGVTAFRPHPLPSPLLQARHQATHLSTWEAEGGLQRQVQTQPKPEGRTGTHWTSLRQPSRSTFKVSNKQSLRIHKILPVYEFNTFPTYFFSPNCKSGQF